MVYDIITQLPYNDHGWQRPDYASSLIELIRNFDCHTIIEIGSRYSGMTGIMACQPSVTQVYAVDIWQDIPGPQADPLLFQQFISNIIYWGLQDKVTPVRLSNTEAPLFIDIEPNMIYFNNDYVIGIIYEQLVAWRSKIINGPVCGDGWDNGTVRASVNRFIRDYRLSGSLHTDSLNKLWWIDPGPPIILGHTALQLPPKK